MRRAVIACLLALAACRGSDPRQMPQAQPAAAPAVAPAAPGPAAHGRDLSVDESMGGHTLARHVGRTDAELAERLAEEPQISAASTWTDRPTAERAVAEALDAGGERLASWERRSGRRPNLVLHYADRSDATLGRSLTRGEPGTTPCSRALVVLKWDERRDRFYVLTAYPEADR